MYVREGWAKKLNYVAKIFKQYCSSSSAKQTELGGQMVKVKRNATLLSSSKQIMSGDSYLINDKLYISSQFYTTKKNVQ